MKRLILSMAILAVAIFALSAQTGRTIQSPGLDVVGFGYDVFGKYADMASKKPVRIFDLVGSRVEPIGTDSFAVPDNIYLEPVVDHRVSIVEGSSVREYAKNLSVTAGLNYDGLLFKASVESNISTSESENVQRFYYTYMDSNVMWRISMDTINMDALRRRMSAQARQEIDTLDPAQVFAKYGTHYIASAYLGGRADYTTSSVISDKVSTASLKIAIEAGYKAISGKSELNADQKKTLQDAETKSELRVVGGNARYVNNIRDYDQYVKWADGIEGRPVLCDFDPSSLRPIWELAAAPARRQQLENAFMELLKTNPLPKELVNLGAVSRSLYMVQSKTEGKYWDLPDYHMGAKTAGAPVQLYQSDRITQPYEGADRFIKVLPNTVESGWVFLQPQHSDYVVEIAGGVKTKGAIIQLGAQSLKNQACQFKMEPVSDEKDTYYLQSRVSGQYLEAVRGSSGIVQMPFTGGEAQKWVFVPTDPAAYMAPPFSTHFAIKSNAGGKYWDFPGTYPSIRGGQVQVWDNKPASGSADRIIELRAVDGLWYTLNPRHLPNHVLSAPSKGRLAVAERKNSNDQLWKFEYAGAPNTYYIRNRATSEVLDLNAEKTNVNGAEVNSWPFHGGDNQKWTLERMTEVAPALHEGTFVIRIKGTDRYLDVSGYSVKDTNKNDANVQVWDLDLNNPDPDRLYRFVPVPDGQGAYVIEVQNGGRVLDMDDENKNGANVKLWTKTFKPDQLWSPASTGDKTSFVVTSLYGSQRNLNISASGLKEKRGNGANAQVWVATGNYNEVFEFVYADGPNKGKLFTGE